MEILLNIFVMFLTFILIVFNAAIVHANAYFLERKDFKSLGIGILFLIIGIVAIFYCVNFVVSGYEFK